MIKKKLEDFETKFSLLKYEDKSKTLFEKVHQTLIVTTKSSINVKVDQVCLFIY